MSDVLEHYDTVILIDSHSNVDELKNLITKKKSIIITFDYQSHKILSQNNIAHEISDNFIDENERDLIQKTSYSLVRWYEEPSLSEFIKYENINLGELYYLELYYILVPFLKKFVEVTKIFNVHTNAKFIAGHDLYEIINSFTQLTSRLKENEESDKFVLDYMYIPLKIGNKSHRFKIKKSHFSKMRNILEKIMNYSLSSQKRIQNGVNTVLLVNFTTLRCKTLFSLSPNFSINMIKYDTLVPAIWNFESYSIIKNSKCIVENHSTLMTKDMKTLIQNEILNFQSKIDSLLNKEIFFKSFFSINGLSFWEIIKPAFLNLCKKSVSTGIPEIQLVNKLLQQYSITSIMIWNERDPVEQVFIKLAKKFDIRIILVEHAILHDTYIRNVSNQLYGILPEYAHKYVSWGKIPENYLKKQLVPDNNIESLGSVFYDDAFAKKLTDSKSGNEFVLLATSSPATEWVPDLTVKVGSDYDMAIKIICKIVTKMNKKLVIKLHPGYDFGEDVIAKEIDPSISVIKGGNILPLIQSCEVFIATDVTTAILEAQIMGKPVISVAVKEPDDYELFSSKSCIRTNIDDFESNLQRLLCDQDFRQKTIMNGNKFIENYFSNHGTATESILRFLEKYN